MYFPSRFRAARSRRSNQFTPFIAVLSAALQSLSDIVLQPIIFLPAIAFLLGASTYQFAGFAVASLAAWAWAGAIVLPLRMLFRREYHLVVAGSIARLAAVIAIGVIGFRLSDAAPGNLVRNLLIAYALYQLATAITARVSTNAISGAASAASRRGLFGNRALWGVIVGVIGGAVIWTVLRSAGSTEENAGLLLILAATSTGAATWFLLAIPDTRRVESTAPYRNRPVGQSLGAFKFRAFRRYLFFRALLAISAAADPFLIVFGLSELGLTLGDVGIAMLIYAGGHVAGMLIWPRLVAYRSARGPLQMSSLLRLLMLIVAVSVPTLSTSELYAERFDGPEAAVRCFIAIFGLLGLIVSANNVANLPYLLDIFPASMAGPAISLTNAIMGGLAFGALGAAYLVNRYSLESTLYVAMGVAFGALMTSGLLVESRVRVRQRFGTRRMHRPMSRSAA